MNKGLDRVLDAERVGDGAWFWVDRAAWRALRRRDRDLARGGRGGSRFEAAGAVVDGLGQGNFVGKGGSSHE